MRWASGCRAKAARSAGPNNAAMLAVCWRALSAAMRYETNFCIAATADHRWSVVPASSAPPPAARRPRPWPRATELRRRRPRGFSITEDFVLRNRLASELTSVGVGRRGRPATKASSAWLSPGDHAGPLPAAGWQRQQQIQQLQLLLFLRFFSLSLLSFLFLVVVVIVVVIVVIVIVVIVIVVAGGVVGGIVLLLLLQALLLIAVVVGGGSGDSSVNKTFKI